MDPDELLVALDPEQREVALAVRGPVCVLAGAGTGKTRAITHRIAYGVAAGIMRPSHILALTFTVRAAGELRGRLRALGAAVPGGGLESVRASTFHAAALRQLVYFWPRVVGGRPPRLVESKLALLREAARDVRIRADGPALAEAVTEIEWAKVRQLHPDSYAPAAMAASRAPSLGADVVARLYAVYEQFRRERQLIDFESVIELTAAIILTEPAAAREVRDAYRYFVVDEFQDVNPLQKLMLDAWLGDRSEICVVGDPRQTIFSFTGATPAYLRSFSIDYPEATVVRLARDYRSTPQVVNIANRLMRGDREGVPARGNRGQRGVVPTGGTEGPDLVSQRPNGPEPSVEEYPDEAAEAAGMASRVRLLIALGVPPREIAILVRINAHTERYEQALTEAGVPYTVRGGERFYDRPEVKQAVVLLRGAARAATDGADATDSMPAAVRHVLASAGLTVSPPTGRGAAREKWESLAAIAALADDMSAVRPKASLADFAAEVTQRAEYGHAPVAAAVTIATMHAAKGLEWDAVLIPGLVEGIMPIVYARTTEAIEEERRLLYVAVTRAREHLVLSWPAWSGTGNPGGQAAVPREAAPSRTRQQSRFLAGITRVRPG
ncbi:MAG: superfamily and helicase [Actinomycetia bacterium]|nr:superfamily and helicase [Actinomycetes bacterium]